MRRSGRLFESGNLRVREVARESPCHACANLFRAGVSALAVHSRYGAPVPVTGDRCHRRPLAEAETRQRDLAALSERLRLLWSVNLRKSDSHLLVVRRLAAAHLESVAIRDCHHQAKSRSNHARTRLYIVIELLLTHTG